MEHDTSARKRPLLTWLALLLALGLVAAACGGGDDDDATDEPGGGGSEETTEEAFDPDGVLRIGSTLVFPAGIHLDPTKSAVNADRPWMEMVFGTLLRQTAEGTIEAWMADSYEVDDPQTLTLGLREGITFPDGTPYDAETVRAGLLRTKDESSEVTVASLSLAFQDITDIEIVDPLTVRISLGSPQAGELVAALADREGVIVSPAQAASAPDEIDSNPVGAGPYVVREFTAGQRVVLEKNPDFWDADAFQLAGVEWIHVGDASSMVNGLLSDVLDLVVGVGSVDAERLRGNDKFVVEPKPNDRSYVFLNLCRSKPPLDDPDVRRALQIGIDRQGVSDLAYNGAATPQLALWPENHVYYNPEVEDLVSHDPEAAEELLGGETVALDIAYLPFISEHGVVAEVLQSQLREVGFDVTLVSNQDPVAEFITPQRAGALLIPGSRTGVDKYNRVFAEGQVQTLCGDTQQDIVDLLAPAAALAPGSPEVTDLFKEADLMVAEDALLIPIVWSPNLAAWNADRLGGEMQFTAALSQVIIETFNVQG